MATELANVKKPYSREFTVPANGASAVGSDKCFLNDDGSGAKVEILRVFSTVDCFVGHSAAITAQAGTGHQGDRIFIPANTLIDMGWYSDSLWIRSTVGAPAGSFLVSGF